MKHFLALFLLPFCLFCQVETGIDRLFDKEFIYHLHKKRVGVITNQTGINREMISTIALLKRGAKRHHYRLSAIFAPEHGLTGSQHTEKEVKGGRDEDGCPIYSLHGKTRRPTKEMLDAVDVLIFDIQDIGSRSYTYLSTLCYVMEEAAKSRKKVVVLDRPNPMGGLIVDGPMMEEGWRSFVGYLNVPYCHGMTVGELARFFNEEYKVGCELVVVPMRGWKRSQTFDETGLAWIPTSPNIPEATSPFYYPATGLIGELQLCSIGIGYTLPFKVVGAPWIDGELLAKKMNEQKFPGVWFQPIHYTPFSGKFQNQECHGVLLVLKDPKKFLPVSTQFLILGMLKGLYPQKMAQLLREHRDRREMFCKVCGTEKIYAMITTQKNIVWKLKALDEEKRAYFRRLRQKYLLWDYS